MVWGVRAEGALGVRNMTDAQDVSESHKLIWQCACEWHRPAEKDFVQY